MLCFPKLAQAIISQNRASNIHTKTTKSKKSESLFYSSKRAWEELFVCPNVSASKKTDA